MARAGAAVVLVLAVYCLLVATAPARRPVDLQAARAANAVVLADLPRSVGAAADCAEATHDHEGTTALAVPVTEEDAAARVEATSGGASALEVIRASSEKMTTVEQGWGWPAVSGKAEDDERRSPYDSDSDSDCDSDSDDEDEGGIFGWLWRLADHLF